MNANTNLTTDQILWIKNNLIFDAIWDEDFMNILKVYEEKYKPVDPFFHTKMRSFTKFYNRISNVENYIADILDNKQQSALPIREDIILFIIHWTAAKKHTEKLFREIKRIYKDLSEEFISELISEKQMIIGTVIQIAEELLHE